MKHSNTSPLHLHPYLDEFACKQIDQIGRLLTVLDLLKKWAQYLVTLCYYMNTTF